jgi:hypothetical protein
LAVCAVAVVGAATLSEMFSQPQVIAPEAKQEEPAKPAGFSVPESKPAGCWEITLANDALSARWRSMCEASAADVKLGAHSWREGVIRLPGTAGEEPRMARAHAESEFSEELALQGEGALLFLPSAASGAGYYVAAWAASDDGEESDANIAADSDEPQPVRVSRGYQVGRYGAPPASVNTPAGRVYLRAEFSPRRAELQHARAETADEPVATEHQDSAPSASTPTI